MLGRTYNVGYMYILCPNADESGYRPNYNFLPRMLYIDIY